MQRIKIPFGGLNPEQMIVLAELAEEYSDAICHITTRQDIQLHFVHIEDTPDIFRRLAAVGITTREACGNSVRNVTACPLAGVCHTEAFDVTPYAKAAAFYLLGHRDTQDFGRKFKIAFSGCEARSLRAGLACTISAGSPPPRSSMARRSRLQALCRRRTGAVPHQAKLLDEFVPEEELLPLSRAIGRVFARLGEKKNRNRARLKFLVQKLGIDEFRRLVLEERQDHAGRSGLARTFRSRSRDMTKSPLLQAVQLNGARRPEGYDEWAKTNVYQQRQSGYDVVDRHAARWAI